MNKSVVFTQFNRQNQTPGAISTELFLNGFLRGWIDGDNKLVLTDITGLVGQANGYKIDSECVLVTAADLGDGIVLPNIQYNGQRHKVRNISGVSIMLYPSVGQQINALGANGALTVADGDTIELVSVPPQGGAIATWHQF